jgi:lipid-A-disaccharide synthase
MTTLLLSAGDASGDLHGAGFVRAFRALCPEARFVGLGGDEMEKAGVELLVHQRDLAIGGFLELSGGLRRIVQAWRSLSRALARIRPDLVVLIDSGGFNLPLARRARRRTGAPIFYYVAPQVWAWRRGRIAKLARRVDRLAVIFPFEPEVYADTDLVVDYVGHPLVEELETVGRRTDRKSARHSLGLASEGPLVAVFPGSRSNEIHEQLPVQLQAIALLHRERPDARYLLALAPTVSRAAVETIVERQQLPSSLELEIVEGRSRDVILAADLALAKPGTITVELALLGRPMVVVGRASRLTAMILKRAVKLPSLAMPNLIAGAPVVPEFLQEEARPARIAFALAELFEGSQREGQLAALEEVRRKLGRRGAARRAAEIAEEMLGSATA